MKKELYDFTNLNTMFVSVDIIFLPNNSENKFKIKAETCLFLVHNSKRKQSEILRNEFPSEKNVGFSCH